MKYYSATDTEKQTLKDMGFTPHYYHSDETTNWYNENNTRVCFESPEGWIGWFDGTGRDWNDPRFPRFADPVSAATWLLLQP